MRLIALFLILLTLTKGFSNEENNWNFSADLLLWTTAQVGADDWAELIDTEEKTLPNRTNKLQEVDFPWDLGFRLGACYLSNSREWDTRLHYTRFNSSGKGYVKGKPGTVHSTFLGNFYVNNPDGYGITGPAYESASIKWKLDFNMFDWDIGWIFCRGEAVEFRLYVGLKGGWINQSVYSTWNNPEVSFNYYTTAKETLENNFYGAGLQTGAQVSWSPFWNQCPEFSIFGDFSGAILYGHWSFSDRFVNDIREKIDVSVPPVNSGAPMVRSFLGCSWESFYACYQWQFKLGFEMQIWLDHLKYYSFTGGRCGNQLTLQGGTVEFNFNF